MKSFLIALQFLTILPVEIHFEIKPKEFGAALLYFPVIGMLIGILLATVAFLLGSFPNSVKSILILIASVFLTSGIHLDGFADTCDGFSSGKSKEEILKIMQDSRIGVMGALAIICLLLLKFTLIENMPKEMLAKSLIMMGAFSRWSQVLACFGSKYARQDGKAKFFIEYAGLKEVVISGLFTVTLFWLLADLKGLGLFLVSLTLVFLCINFMKKKLDGMTGDTIGATNEIAEAGILFFILCFY